jgi:hypothetical protein
MMAGRGLGGSPLFAIDERPVDEAGLLPPDQVAEIRGWLHGLAANAHERSRVVRQTLDGAIGSLARRSVDVAAAQGAQIATADRLRVDVHQAYADALREVGEASADGSLLRGEVLARWQEFVGTGELFRALESRVGRVRDRITGWFSGRPPEAERVSVAVESGLESLLVEHAEAAAERSWRSWSSVDAGKRLLEGAPAETDLGRASRVMRGRAERAVRDWQRGVLEMVRTEGADKRTTARFLAFGVNGLSVALMIVVFAHTAGLTGAEAGIAGGSAVVGQKLLEAVFGDQAVRRLADRARSDLESRTAELYAEESGRYYDLLDGLDLHPERPEQLRAAADRVAVLQPTESR